MSFLDIFKNKINILSCTSLHTNKLGLARSSLAFGTLSSFLFNNANDLFNTIGKTGTKTVTFTPEGAYTLFNLLDNNFILTKIICLLVLTAVIFGFYPRLTCIPHWYVTWSYFNSSAIIDGGDQITAVLVLLLLPICLTDKRKNHWSTNPLPETLYFKYVNILNNATYLIIQIQVSLLYFEAAIGKFKVDEWSNGTSVYYWLNQSWFGVPNYLKPLVDIVIENKYGVTLLTWGTLIFEVILFTGLFMTINRKRILLFFGIAFHFSFLLLLGLFSFYFAMFGALILYLGNIKTNFTTSKSFLNIWKTI